MDPLQHLYHKLNAERTFQSLRHQQATPPLTGPPPYTTGPEEEMDFDSDSDDTDPNEERPSPIRLTINAAHSIHGSNNLVPITPNPLTDATRLSTVLLSALHQLQTATSDETLDISSAAELNAQARPIKRARAPKKTMRVAVVINCGITVIGDRNVIGNIALKPKSPSPSQSVAVPMSCSSPPPSVAGKGTKRKLPVSDQEDKGEVETEAGGERVWKKECLAVDEEE
ncbi:hypothetical protein LTR62_000391 [Meristemomyces frigidus]|uniref:Uncharacterized protein n=1 Tax=Meristemomyces frigidus TaxID=1508187 RepID=A0AAN7TTV7_9PEZI|nr:hypothetical protein LTR62_000391 [Meristemomyces frigidus]